MVYPLGVAACSSATTHFRERAKNEQAPPHGPRSHAGPPPGARSHGAAPDPPPYAGVRSALRKNAARPRMALPDGRRRHHPRRFGFGRHGGGGGEPALSGRFRTRGRGGQVRRALDGALRGIRDRGGRSGGGMGPLGRHGRSRSSPRAGRAQGPADAGERDFHRRQARRAGRRAPRPRASARYARGGGRHHGAWRVRSESRGMGPQTP